MDEWNPLEEDFNSIAINSYNQGAGANLPMEYLPQHKKLNNGTIRAISLYVSGLPRSFDEISLKNLFAQYGKIQKVHMGQTRNSAYDYSYGFVDFETVKEAERAIAGLNEKVLDNHPIKVSFTKNTESKLKQQKLEMEDEKNGRGANKKVNYVSSKSKNTNYHQNSTPGLNKTVEISDSNLRVVVPNTNSLPVANGRNDQVNTQYFLNQCSKRSNVPMENATATQLGYHLNHLINGTEDVSKMPISDMKPQSCDVCGNLAFFICGQCKSAWYCCQNCQFEDWFDHKRQCVGNRFTTLSSTKINEILYPSSTGSSPKALNESSSSSNNENQRDIIDKRVPISVFKPDGNHKDKKPACKLFSQNSLKDDVTKPLRRPNSDITNKISSDANTNGASKIPACVIPPSVLTSGDLAVGQDISLIVVWKEADGQTICCSVYEGSNMRDIQNKLNTESDKDLMPSKSLSVGNMVVALSVEDRMWYRAIVIGCGDKSTQVFYVDYGNTETVEKIRRLSVNDLEIPSYLLIAKSDKSQNFFKEISLNSVLQGKLVSISKNKVMIEVIVNKNTKMQLACYPWNHELELIKSSSIKSSELEMNKTSIVMNVQSFNNDLKLPVYSLSSNDDDDCVYVVHITSADGLYIQKTKESNIMDKLIIMIRDHCTKNSYQNKSLPQVGYFVCARLTDGEWYRAKVLSIDSKSNMISVFLVDFGNQALVNVVDIKPLPPAAYSTPAFAYPANLHLVPKLTTEQRKLLTSQEWKLKVESAAKGSQKHSEIKLFNNKMCANDFINQHLPPLTDDNLIPKAPNSKSDISPKSVMADDIPKLQLAIGQKANLLINHYENPHLIFCMNLDEKSVSNFQKLSVEIARYCQNIQPNANFMPIEGQVVLAKYSEDESWYRAVALNITEHEAYLFFVDYGNFEKVKIDEMVPLPPSFSTIPSQAVTTALNAIKPNEKWDSDEIAKLKAIFLQDKNLIECFVESYNDSDDLYFISIENTNIDDFLKSKNLKIADQAADEEIVDDHDVIAQMKQQIELLKLELTKAKKK